MQVEWGQEGSQVPAQPGQRWGPSGCLEGWEVGQIVDSGLYNPART